MGGVPIKFCSSELERILRVRGSRACSGNARVRRGMIQLAWRFLMFQKDSALAKWYRQRTANAPSTRKTLVVALARKLLIALWRLVRDGVVPEGVGNARHNQTPRVRCPRYRVDATGAPKRTKYV